MFGYYAGPNVYVVDELALADALLARLPARRVDQWRIGHFQRTLPAGYLDTLRVRATSFSTEAVPTLRQAQLGHSSRPVGARPVPCDGS